MDKKINNLPSNYWRYVVARKVDGELWFWGSWASESEAYRVASTFENGEVIDTAIDD